MFRKKVRFYSEELLSPPPTPKLKDKTLLAVRDSIFIIFESTAISETIPPIACHSVVTETHLSPRRWMDNIKTDLEEVGCGSMNWTELALDRDRWRAIVNTVMKLRVP